MAEYVVVDKAKLNGDLETIGNAIRTQTEKTAKLHFPEELEREILSIVKAKPEQEKTVEITENGTVEVTPDLGKVLSKIIANVNVASSGGGGVSGIATGTITPLTDGKEGIPITHNLGSIPKIAVLFRQLDKKDGYQKKTPLFSYAENGTKNGYSYEFRNVGWNDVGSTVSMYNGVINLKSSKEWELNGSSFGSCTETTAVVKPTYNSSLAFEIGATYRWILIAEGV